MICNRLVTQRVDKPFATCLRIHERFDRGEGFAADDKKSGSRVEIAKRLKCIVAVNVADKTAFELAGAEIPKCLVSHRRPEVATADSDVHDRGDPLAGGPDPGSAA